MASLFSVITAVFNRVRTIDQAIDSVRAQDWPNVQYVVVDGGSTDGTLDRLRARASEINTLVSEPDHGIYDALNKGLKLARGDFIGLLHSDDYYADRQVLTSIADAFRDEQVDGVYGDLDYVSKSDGTTVVRRWRSGQYHPSRLRFGWMPPHPTLFLRRAVIEQWGAFDTAYKIAADYDAILRYLAIGHIRLAYVPRVLMKMRLGGESNRSLDRLLRKSHEDYRALRQNRVGGFFSLACKNARKLRQFT